MKLLPLLLVLVIVWVSGCTGNSTETTTTTTTADSITTKPPVSTVDLDTYHGVFMVIKAKTGQKDQLVKKLRLMSFALNHGASGPDVFAVHTYPTEPETVYIYSLRNANSANPASDPVIVEIKAKANENMASMTIYPLNTLFGRLPGQ